MPFVSAGLIDPRTGRARRANIRSAIRELVDRPLYPTSFPVALQAVIRAARKEQETVRSIIAAKAVNECRAVERQAEARVLAARYGCDVERLAYEVDRRSAGSFTLTLDGGPEQRDLYRAAHGIAVERRARLDRRIAARASVAAQTCSVCSGDGSVQIFTADGAQTDYAVRCPHCTGFGKVAPEERLEAFTAQQAAE